MAPRPLLRSRRKIKINTILLTPLLICMVLLAACGGGSAQQGTKQHVLTIGAQVGADFTNSFSPFSPLVNPGVRGLVYETLIYFARGTGQVTPMLASSYDISSDAKSITFTIRPNVKWSDGTAFTADDVVFTFNLLKQYPAADTAGVWSFISSVTSPGPDTVLVSLKSPYSPALWYIGGQTFIVPKHIWASAGDPTKFANSKPIGTGPFLLQRYTPQELDYVKNPGYWQTDKVQVDKIVYPSVKDNNALLLKLLSGQIDWGSFYAPDLQNTFVARDPAHNHYYMAPVALTMIYLNYARDPVFKNLALRQAISYALDRQSMSTQAESGYESVASPTGLVLPIQQSYLSPNLAGMQFTYDKNKAISILDAAGFKKGSDGIYVSPNGTKLSFSIKVPAGWTDWDEICQIISQNLQAIGIKVSVDQISQDDYFPTRTNGNFDMLMGGSFYGPTPYYMLDPMLNSSHIGVTNWEHWSDPLTDKYLNQYATSTDPSVQKQAIMGIEQIMANQMPTILLLNAAEWYEYSTKNFVGWPDQNNLYAYPAGYEVPDEEQVVLHLRPV